MTRPPPCWTARATAPISPVLPPPYTRACPCRAISAPSASAASKKAESSASLDEQYTQMVLGEAIAVDVLSSFGSVESKSVAQVYYWRGWETSGEWRGRLARRNAPPGNGIPGLKGGCAAAKSLLGTGLPAADAVSEGTGGPAGHLAEWPAREWNSRAKRRLRRRKVPVGDLSACGGRRP